MCRFRSPRVLHTCLQSGTSHGKRAAPERETEIAFADTTLFFVVGALRLPPAARLVRVIDEITSPYSRSSSTSATLTTSRSTGDTGEGEEMIEGSEWESEGVGESAVATCPRGNFGIRVRRESRGVFQLWAAASPLRRSLAPAPTGGGAGEAKLKMGISVGSNWMDGSYREESSDVDSGEVKRLVWGGNPSSCGGIEVKEV